MSIDRVTSKSIPDYFRREDAPGFKFDTGPYLGVVKDNRDNTRSGRLQVYIPEIGGDENDVKNWRTVSYASPFMGTTTQEQVSPGGKGSEKNSFKTVRHSYGMWYNVPDIGNLVLCIFVSGDPSRGFYFASVPNQLGHHMVPAISSSSDVDAENIEDSNIKSLYRSGKIGPELPVVEFNEYNKKVSWENFTKEKKPLHEPQVKILIEQGTDRPKLTGSRGMVTSTSQRETPAGVFGVSTPGRSIKAPPPQDAKSEIRVVPTRMGGHSFVMDDGDNSSQKGKNNLTRWRSSGGHQILMDDSANIVYISNSNGSAWIEMTGSGHINIYSTNSVNLRTAADLNLHVDRDFNLQIDGSFNVKVKNDINIESDNTNLRSIKETKIFGAKVGVGSEGRIDLDAASEGSFTATKGALKFTGEPILLNAGRGPKVIKPRDVAIKTHPDTKKDGQGQWQIEPDKIKSVAKIVPTHEPWERKTGKDSTASNSPAGPGDNQSSDITQGDPPDTGSPNNRGDTTGGAGGQVLQDSSGNPVRDGDNSQPGIVKAGCFGVSNPAPASAMKDPNAPTHSRGFGNGLLSPDQSKALSVQLGYSESRNSYDPYPPNPLGYLGKYQMGAAALVDAGYIKPSAYEQYGGSGNRVLMDKNAWTGKNGVGSREDFINNPSAQEDAHVTNTELIIQRGLKTGYISKTDDAGTIGGKIMTAHLLGVKGAKNWLESGVGKDANNVGGEVYFNRGKYAVQVLSDSGKG
jgi:hypothetical protein